VAAAAGSAALPPTGELLYERRLDPETKQERRIPIVVQKKAMLTGADVADAEVRLDQGNQPYVSLTLTPAGGKVFAQVTTDNVGKLMAIVLDGNVYSAPRIQERIPSGQAQITGSFTLEQARDLKIVLKAGALPAPVQILEERSVGPSLGADSIRKGILSTAGAAIAVVVFMLIYYRLSGFIADVALALNLLILLAAMAGFHATLTLPGIAGVVLTIGMAVDTNILIFERIREELRSGKTVRAAIDSGFARAFRTVIDTHVTVLVSAAILYQFGTGPVKGFAVTLAIGIFASLFTAVFFTRLIFDIVYMRGARSRASLSRAAMLQIFVNANYDFVGKRRWFYLVSGGFMVLSLVSILFRGGLNYGIDFTGGTLVQVRYDKPVTVEVVRRGLDEIKLGQAVIQQFGDAQEYLIRLHQAGDKPDALSREVQAALAKASGANVEIRRLEFVGPQVGRDLQLQALYAVLAGMAGILIYVAFRFHFRDGVISVIAIAHDVIVTLGALSVTHREISLPVLAALLTIRRLLDQRHHCRLRPDPGDPGQGHPEGSELGRPGQCRDEPDAVPDRAHLLHSVPFRAGPPALRRRGPPRFLLRPPRGGGDGHVLVRGRCLAGHGLGDVEPGSLAHAAKGAGQGLRAKSPSKTLISMAELGVNLGEGWVDPATDADRGDSEVPAGRRPGAGEPRLPLLGEEPPRPAARLGRALSLPSPRSRRTPRGLQDGRDHGHGRPPPRRARGHQRHQGRPPA
jgi:protein-export membrane protein SecD